MRLAYLYLRSRQAGRAVTLLGLIAGLAWTWQALSHGPGPSTLLLVIPPLGAALVIGTSVTPTFGDLEATVSGKLAPLRLLQLLSLLTIATLGLAAACGWANWMTVRNVAGLTGLALLGAHLLGSAGAWAPLLGYGIYALLASPALVWNWPVHSASDGSAALIAVALLVLGFAGIVHAGASTRLT